MDHSFVCKPWKGFRLGILGRVTRLLASVKSGLVKDKLISCCDVWSIVSWERTCLIRSKIEFVVCSASLLDPCTWASIDPITSLSVVGSED